MGDKPKNELEAVEVRRRRGFRKLLAFAGLLSGEKNRKDPNRRTTLAAETTSTSTPTHSGVPSSPLAILQEEASEDNNNISIIDSPKNKHEDSPLPSPGHRQTVGGSQIIRSTSSTSNNRNQPVMLSNVASQISTSAGSLGQEPSPLAHLENQLDEATRNRLATEGGRANKRHSVFMVLFKGKNSETNGLESERKQDDKEKHAKPKEKPKEKEKKEEPHPPTVEETIIATCFEELPAETQKSFLNAKLDLEDLKNPCHWLIICHIASFRLNKRIYNAPPEPKTEAGPDSHRATTVEEQGPHVAQGTQGAQGSQEGQGPQEQEGAPDLNNSEKQHDIVIANMTLDECEEKFILKNVDQNPKKLYKNLIACGEGGYGRVYHATSVLDKGKIAIKKIPHTIVKERRHNVQEIFYLTSCKHPNIVKYVRTHCLNDELWIILEYMEGGTLGEAVAAYSFDENQIAFVAREMLMALYYLHERKWAHRDLKSSNIMMTVGGEVKLVDFGLCADLSEGGKTHMCGSPYWMPPEMIRKEPHGVLVDIWSLAICLLELANKHPPNYKNPVKAMFEVATVGIREPFENSGSWSETFRNFTSLCLVDASSRATAELLKGHDFIKKAAPRHVMEKVFRRLFLTNMMMPLP